MPQEYIGFGNIKENTHNSKERDKHITFAVTFSPEADETKWKKWASLQVDESDVSGGCARFFLGRR